MRFYGISRDFSLENDGQYDTIGAFWDEMADRFGLENLIGLGYMWRDGKISYAIGLKAGKIEGADLELDLPDSPWTLAEGETDALPALYREIYKDGALLYELEEFFPDGRCRIRYLR